MYKFTYSADSWDETKIKKREILDLILKHQLYTAKFKQNQDYYNGKHIINNRTRTGTAPNNKVVCNHAKDISDTASGYFMGNPITYKNTGEKDIEPLLKAFDDAQIDDTDSDLALDLSINGVGYEYIYAKKDETTLNSKTLEPDNTFMVCDDTIEENELFAVYYWKKKDDTKNKESWMVTILTKNYKYNVDLESDYDSDGIIDGGEQHLFGEIPIIEYLNNKYGIGDFEQQIPLIDAYNTLMSDRINDKEQFIDALLIIYGASLGDDEEETKAAAKTLRENKLLELPENSKAEYLLRTLDENGMETLRKAIKEDIYTFSHVPNLTDDNFAGNNSGVAMEFKLLGLEMLTKIKTRYYKKGLRKRIKLFCNYLDLSQIKVEANSIVADFARTLPKNLLELSQVIANLRDDVSAKTLVRLLPFVEDPDKELEEVQKEKQQDNPFYIETNTKDDVNE